MAPPAISPSVNSTTSAPRTFKLSRLHSWPMRSPTDASPTPSRVPAHGSGPMRIATPSSWWTFTSYSLPVLIGAPKFLISARSLVTRQLFRPHLRVCGGAQDAWIIIDEEGCMHFSDVRSELLHFLLTGYL